MQSTLYLRSTSLNTFNGMIWLTFSCGGSHDMHFDEFLGTNQSIAVLSTEERRFEQNGKGATPLGQSRRGGANRPPCRLRPLSGHAPADMFTGDESAAFPNLAAGFRGRLPRRTLTHLLRCPVRDPRLDVRFGLKAGTAF